MLACGNSTVELNPAKMILLQTNFQCGIDFQYGKDVSK